MKKVALGLLLLAPSGALAGEVADVAAERGRGVVHVVLTARRCLLNRLLVEARATGEAEPRLRLEELLRHTDQALSGLGLRPLHCQRYAVRGAGACLPSIHGADAIPFACTEPGSKWWIYFMADEEMPFPPRGPRTTNPGMVCKPREAPLTGEECRYVGPPAPPP
jgi:hypothetical protein